MNAIIRHSKSAWLTFDQIDFPANARPTTATDVVALVSSIRALGLQVPLTVIERDGRYLLIAGRHRLEALRIIGKERVPARVVDFDDIEARLWMISDNLHRTELTVVERLALKSSVSAEGCSSVSCHRNALDGGRGRAGLSACFRAANQVKTNWWHCLRRPLTKSKRFPAGSTQRPRSCEFA
jgi:ParB/RepB/Spo0J family partition protein